MARTGRIAEFAGYRLDFDERTLQSPSGIVEQLSSRLFDTLVLLLERAGQLVGKDDLLARVWAGAVVEENTLSRTVSSLRRRVGEEAEGAHRLIETVSGHGYRLCATVRYSVAPRVDRREDLPTLAVLPFEDLSPGRDQQHVADGFADELISALAAVPSLRVTARSSSFQLRGADVASTRDRLGATHVLSGAVRHHDDQLRASVQLVDAGTGRQLWAAQRAGPSKDLFALQEAIAEAVRQGLRQVFGLTASATQARHQPDATAYDLYLRARALAHTSGGPALMQACQLLRQAVSIDPAFALAWSQLSVWAGAMILFGAPTSEDLLRVVEEAAERTMTLDPDWAPAHVARSTLSHLRREWFDMEQALNRARALPGSQPAELMIHIASMQLFVGRPRTALDALHEAIDRDPLSLVVSGIYQLAMHVCGDEDGAEREYQRCLTLPGDREMVEHLAIHRLWAQRRPFDAQLRRYLECGSTALPFVRELAPIHDQPDRAVALLTEALAEPQHGAPARQLMIAWWLAHYEAHDAAMAVLWRVHVERGHINTSWLWFPVHARVRALPRFAELLERLGFTRYWQQSGTRPEIP